VPPLSAASRKDMISRYSPMQCPVSAPASKNTRTTSAPPTRHGFSSAFATVRLRTKVAKGAGSAAAALALVFELVESAQAR
jgi:hypothetical protein